MSKQMDNNENNMWKSAHDEAWKVNVDARKVYDAGKDVPMKMRLLANYEHQFKFLTWKCEYGNEIAEMMFNKIVKRAENEKLYETFRARQLAAGVFDADIISLQTFLLHSKRAMEYADFCEEQIKKWGATFVADCGGVTCDYHQFLLSRCREIANE